MPNKKGKARHFIEMAGFELVAGACNHQNLRSRECREVLAARLAGFASRFQVGASFGSVFDHLITVAA